MPSSALGLEPDTGASTKSRGATALGDRARGGRGDRRHVDDQRALRQRCRGAVLAEQHLLDLRGVGHHRDEGVGALGGLGGRGRRAGAVLGGEALGLLARARVDGQLEARLAQVARHRAAHDAQADEADSAQALPCPPPPGVSIRSRSPARSVPDAFAGQLLAVDAGSYPGRRARHRPRPGGACRRRSVISE